MGNIIGGPAGKIINFRRFKDPQVPKAPKKSKSIFCSDEDVIEIKRLLAIKKKQKRG